MEMTKIYVEGEASLSAPVDTMEVSFLLSVNDKDGRGFGEKKEIAESKFFSQLRKLTPIKPVFISTEIQKKYRYENNESVFSGYILVQQYRMRLDFDFTLLSDLFSLTEKREDSETLVNVSFSSSKEKDKKEQALVLALQEAKRKATLIADSMDLTLDSIESIKGTDDAPLVCYSKNSDQQIEDVKISSHVEVNYLARKK